MNILMRLWEEERERGWRKGLGESGGRRRRLSERETTCNCRSSEESVEGGRET